MFVTDTYKTAGEINVAMARVYQNMALAVLNSMVVSYLVSASPGLMGLSFASIFVVFQMGSIVNAFMGAAILFGTMSFYGYFTKKDLTSMGQFMFVGLIAIIIASIVNIFVGSTVFQMVIS